MSRQRGEVITRYNICGIASNAYGKSLSPANIIAFFKKTGISPFAPDVVPNEKLIPSESLTKTAKHASHQQIEEVADFLQKKMDAAAPKKIQSPETVKPNKPKIKRLSFGGNLSQRMPILMSLNRMELKDVHWNKTMNLAN